MLFLKDKRYNKQQYQQILLPIMCFGLQERIYLEGQIKFIRNLKGTYSQDPW